MEKLQQLAELQRQVADAQRHGVELLTEAFGTPAEQLPLDRELARSVARAAEHFSGAAYSRYKKRALEAARRNGHGLDVLILIAERARMLGIKQRYVFTEALCNTAGDYAAISRRATQLRREMQGPRIPADGGRRIMHGKKTTIQFTGPSHRMSEIWESARTDPLAWLTENRTIQRSTLTTNVVVSLDDYMQVLGGHGDEIELQATTGAVLTGAEYVARRLEEAGIQVARADGARADGAREDDARVAQAPFGAAGTAGPTGTGAAGAAAGVGGTGLKDGDYITLIAPEQGPVNLYRVRRLASRKQRRMLEAETTRCSWPGCGRPANECQVHHLQEFAKGGETNPENMALLCAYHNGVNGQHGRGRMARVSGRVTWLPPG
ncbi:HNH endonuclease signature motif containing protein [Corynebacterium macclintockiae]|uniref:HNH endonuclease signature motif containing protein n=1 Tax=Corynebacterium macclintockiae TaxID=2913501 RepID=UPI0025505DC8|nr:HNH endonuclease signature motif containing protein [Corynebacterium macclintockiae]MDK8869444.1 HNH endonuclease signature motif containing protein [Corynebacterium macclintockiae]